MSQILIAGGNRSDWPGPGPRVEPWRTADPALPQAGRAGPGRHWLPVDFEHLDEVALPTPIDLAFCCLGTTSCKEAGSAQGFPPGRPRLCAGLCRSGPPPAVGACWWSPAWGQSARSRPLSRTQGLEQALLAQEWQRLVIPRPPCCWAIASHLACLSS